MKKSFLSGKHAWIRIARAICAYNGNGSFNTDLYPRIKDNEKCQALCRVLLKRGFTFGRVETYKWSYELLGTFEVTRRDYTAPAGISTVQGGVIYEEVQKAIENLYGTD